MFFRFVFLAVVAASLLSGPAWAGEEPLSGPPWAVLGWSVLGLLAALTVVFVGLAVLVWVANARTQKALAAELQALTTDQGTSGTAALVRMSDLKADLARLDERIKDTRSWVGSVSARHGELKGDVAERIAQVRADCASREDLARLEGELDQVRGELAQLRSEVRSVADDTHATREQVGLVDQHVSQILAILSPGASHG